MIQFTINQMVLETRGLHVAAIKRQQLQIATIRLDSDCGATQVFTRTVCTANHTVLQSALDRNKFIGLLL
jgi:hypothetical protein